MIGLHDVFDNAVTNTFTDYTAADLDWHSSETVSSSIGYIADIDLWDIEKPFCLRLPLPEGATRTNQRYERQPVEICDVRGRERTFTLDRHGFAFARISPFSFCFEDTEEVENAYLKDTAHFIKKTTNADEVFIFDYTRRRRGPRGTNYDPIGYRPPGLMAHIDQTPNAALSRLRLHFGENGPSKLKGRMQILNLWRPIFGPLEDYPMAVCDSRSLHDDDLIPSDLVFPHYAGEKFNIKASPNHRWYYLSKMTDSECLLIKNFDSALDGRARFCAHSAFDDPTASEGRRFRESIEVRAMVFHHDWP